MMGRSGWWWWERVRDVRVRSVVFVRKKAGWGMVGQNRAEAVYLEGNATNTRRTF